MTVGHKGESKSSPNQILLRGLNIQDKHATITRTKGGEKIELIPGPDALGNTRVNGVRLTKSIALHHKDRILFGTLLLGQLLEVKFIFWYENC